MKNQNSAALATKKKSDRLPIKLERLIEALTAGINAASKSPTGRVNVADFLDASQIRMLCRLAAKGGQTPQQFIQGISSRAVRKVRAKQEVAA